MKVYIAGSFVDQKSLRPIAESIWQLNHEIVGTWLQEVKKPSTMSPNDFKKKLAIKDVAEVCTADLIILDNRQSSGGKNCEWGIGLASFQHKQLWLVGEPSNVFHYLADCVFSNWDEVIEELKKND